LYFVRVFNGFAAYRDKKVVGIVFVRFRRRSTNSMELKIDALTTMGP
jgi:hypothetical protein